MEQGEGRDSLLQAVLAPLVRLCLRHQFKFAEITREIRDLLVSHAMKSLERHGHERTASRIAIMTGVSRRDVSSRLRGAQSTSSSQKINTAPNLIAAVIGRWQSDKKFCRKDGTPKDLTFGGGGSDFNKLVNETNKDLNPATVLFELERVGAVKKSESVVTLKVNSFVPRGDAKRIFGILGEDLRDLTHAVEQNVFITNQTPNLHARTYFDRIRADKEEELRQWLLVEGHTFHAKVREKLSSLDLDLNPDSTFSGATFAVCIGAFSLIKKEEDI